MPRATTGPSPHVVVVGGGVMGCASAWRLAQRGIPVTVLEQSLPGAEASSSAAGILGAQVEAHAPGPLFEALLESRALHARWARELARATSIDVGYRARGVLRVAYGRAEAAALARDAAWQRRAGQLAERVTGAAARRLEPELARDVAGGVYLARDAQLDPRRLLEALRIAAAAAGARFTSDARVRRVTTTDARATGVELDGGRRLPATHVVVAAGSWTSLIDGLGDEPRVEPARGQIVELRTATPLLARVVFGPDCYLVPRDDGRLLIGSTLEFVGFRREVTAGAVRDLLAAALRLVPALAGARFADAWSSFRPHTQDELPLVGPSRIAGLVFATGHYRNGILLGPVTAELVVRSVLGKKLPAWASSFAPGGR